MCVYNKIWKFWQNEEAAYREVVLEEDCDLNITWKICYLAIITSEVFHLTVVSKLYVLFGNVLTNIIWSFQTWASKNTVFSSSPFVLCTSDPLKLPLFDPLLNPLLKLPLLDPLMFVPLPLLKLLSSSPWLILRRISSFFVFFTICSTSEKWTLF